MTPMAGMVVPETTAPPLVGILGRLEQLREAARSIANKSRLARDGVLGARPESDRTETPKEPDAGAFTQSANQLISQIIDCHGEIEAYVDQLREAMG